MDPDSNVETDSIVLPLPEKSNKEKCLGSVQEVSVICIVPVQPFLR